MNTLKDSTQTVGQFFARMTLGSNPSAALDGWQQLPVESYFVAINLPASPINRERKECGNVPAPLMSLFADIQWG